MIIRIPLVILSAIILVMAFPPFSVGVAAWAALVPFMFALDGSSVRKGFFLGFVFGFFFFLGTVYWVVHSMYVYGNVPALASVGVMLLLVLYLSLFTGAFGGVFVWASDLSAGSRLLLAPALWVALEFLRGHLFTGFPWVLLGYTQAHHLPIIQIADHTGVWGISFLIVAVNAALFFVVRSMARGGKAPVREALVVIFVFASTVSYGLFTVNRVDKETPSWGHIKVAVTQGSIDQGVKWDKSYQQKTLEIYRSLSVNSAYAGARLIVWPETAIPFYFEPEKVKDGFVGEIARDTGSYLLTGSPSYNYNRSSGGIEYFNSAYLVSPAGEVAGRYDKIHLVPFGEYVPLKSILPFRKLTEDVGDFTEGPGPVPIRFEGGGIGVLICYESIFPEIARREVKNGASFLVNMTNDGWFGRTSAPYQHFEMSILRAVENKTFYLRSANTGISAIIDPAGRVVKLTKLFEKAALAADIGLKRGGLTFYTVYGDVFAWGSIVLASALILTGLIRRR